MRIYLADRKRDINAFKRAIKLCKEDSNTIKVLKEYLKRIDDEYKDVDFIKNNFIPLIQNREDFYQAFIFCIDNGNYRVEAYIYNANDTTKKEYMDIYDDFCDKNEEDFLYFYVYDIKKEKYMYDEAVDDDKIVIKHKK